MADENQLVEVKLEPEQKELDLGQSSQVEAPAKPEGVDVLKAQLAEMQQRDEQRLKVLQQTEQIARQQQADAVKYRQQAEQAQVEVADSRYQTIVNTIDAFRRDSELAKRDYTASLANGNIGSWRSK